MKKVLLGPIPYGRQYINEDDIKAVSEVLTSDYLTQGPKIEEFEKKFSDYIGADYSVAVSNGTAALHLAVLALGVQPGQKVITTPITFAASANCVLYAGGEVDFADIGPDTFLIDIDQIEQKLSKAKEGEYAGIIPVDFTGLAVDTEKLRKIADKYNVWILEDACHAPGGSFVNSEDEEIYCGDCTYADAAIFSFHPVKHIATGEGGMITTNDKELKNKIEILRTHGITKDPDLLKENHGGWYYEMQELGYNYRLTDIQCALGLSQLKRADESLGKRREKAKRYDHAFENISSIVTQEIDEKIRENHHAFHLYVIQVENRRKLYNYLKEHEIYTQIHYIPVHTLPYYRQFGWEFGDFPNSEKYYEDCISLPMYPTLCDDEQDLVIKLCLSFLNG